MKYKLSVIVPVYNAQKYAKAGLLSLLNQTIIKEIEVIIIDDGSTDQTSSILTEFCYLHKNFKYFYEDNQGVSVARNLGLQVATANLIGFFDIDDYIEPTYFQRLLSNQKKYNSDITISDFVMCFSDNSRKKHRPNIKKIWNNNLQMQKDFFSGNFVGNNVVDKIFKKEILKDVFFPTNFAVGEDMYFVYEALKHAHVMYLNAFFAGYHYIIRKNSTMTSEFNEKYYDAVKLSKKMVNDTSLGLTKYANVHLLHEECKLLENMIKNNGVAKNRSQYNLYRKKIKKFNVLEVYKILNKKQFWGLMLMRVSPKLYIKIHDLMRIG